MSMNSGVRTCAVASVAVLLVVLPALAAAPVPTPALPAGVSADWWSQARRSIELEEYGIQGEGTERAPFRATNPAQRFEVRFAAGAVRLTPADGGDWEWGLSLTGWGRAEALQAVRLADRRAEEDRVEFDRGDLKEWFVNTPAGLEHGFTVPVRPRGAGDGLVLDLALAGGLRPVFAEDGQAIDFYSRGNVSVLRYATLVVTDAAGRTVPARMEPVAGGVRIAVDDRTASYPLTIDPLATSAAWTAVGEGPDDRFGYSVAAAGDVNGDGYSDVLIGAYGFSTSRGKAYVYLGRSSGLSESASWTQEGASSNSSFGRSVATAGDVNGDGYSDIVIGADGESGNRGKAYLYLGGQFGLSASWTAVGESSDNRFGGSVASAGDVNGDGYSDVLVGAPGQATGRGKAFLYLGGSSGLLATASWSAVGEAGADAFGCSVAPAGDVDGDGDADVIVGASGHATRGKAYVYLGQADGLSPTASWTAPGEAVSDRFGEAVAGAGDVNGDGYADVVVGASGSATFTGKAFLYLGGSSGPSPTASWTAAGEAVGSNFGVSVATAGDIDGDGYADVLVGAQGSPAFTGRAYLYRGGSGGLSPAASWTAVAPATDDRFGYSVAPAGDVNGDGFADVLLGAYGAAARAGAAYLYVGSANTLSAAAQWTGAPDTTNAFYGYSVASAGDVNGDGYADVAVGAPHQASSRGKVYVYLGRSSGLSGTPSWTATGQANLNEFGQSVASAGDVNGDGYADLVVGAWGYNLMFDGAGRAYVYLGSASGLGANPSPILSPPEPGSFGHSVASAGDVNGDGYSDVVIGAIGAVGRRGKAYVYLGRASGLSTTPAWSAVGEQSQDNFGTSVAGAGDVDGDGYADVVIGAVGYPGGGGEFPQANGRAYLYRGGPSGPSVEPSWIVTGDLPSRALGRSVASAGDVNGDGYSDVVVGADARAGGKAFVFLGSPKGLSENPSWSGGPAERYGYYGYSVASAGDVNGDGYSDVLVGDYGSNSGTGKAHLYLGSASGLSTEASWTAVGEATDHRFGWSVAPAGDVNGDGYPDVVIGAYRFSNSTGKAYLYLGGSDLGGVTVLPRQFRADLTTPLSLGGAASDRQFGLGLKPQRPAGRVKHKLQWQVAPQGNGFLSSVNPLASEAAWSDSSLVRTVPVGLNEYRTPVIWRARVRYDPVTSPFVHRGPWFTMVGNGRREADLINASGGPCTVPGAELYISRVTLFLGLPVLTSEDTNPPAAVTGYNVYRASTPVGPWTLLETNAPDKDLSLPGVQLIDGTGDAGATWFYQVAAFNASCGEEGPW